MYHYALKDYAQKDIADRIFVQRMHEALDVGGELSALDARATSEAKKCVSKHRAGAWIVMDHF